MKYIHKPTEVEATLFDAPEASSVLDIQEIKQIERRYGVKRIGTAEGAQWQFGSYSSPTRAIIAPGDYIVSAQGIEARVLDGRYFLTQYEPS